MAPSTGIVAPGGFGARGSDVKIASVRFALELNVPFFGICLGMQMACIDAARAVGLDKTSTTEFGYTEEPVVGLITEWMSKAGLERRAEGGNLGGPMRLGAYDPRLSPNSHVASLYNANHFCERHRHRYDVKIGTAHV